MGEMISKRCNGLVGIVRAYDEVLWHIACAFCHCTTATKDARITIHAKKVSVTCVNLVKKLIPANAELQCIFDGLGWTAVMCKIGCTIGYR